MSEKLCDYVPRHKRLGSLPISCELPSTHDVSELIPIVDETGNVVNRVNRILPVSAADDMAKYRFEDFKLDNLLEAGVPLNTISVQMSHQQAMSRILDIASNLDKLDEYSKLVAQQNAERDEFLKPIVSPSNSVENE